MLSKLLKYDLKYMLKKMIIFYVLSIMSALLARFFLILNQTTFTKIMSGICVGIMFSMVFSTLFNTVIRSWVRFNASLYGDESYLSHTLPVTREELFEAKFLENIIFSLVGFGIFVLSIAITYASKDNIIVIKDFLTNLSSSYNINVYVILFLMILLLYIEIINTVQVGFIGIIIGQRYQNNKILYSFIYGFLFYLVSQLIMLLVMFIIGLFNSNIMSIFTSNSAPDSKTIMFLGIIGIVLYTLIVIGYNFISIKLFKHRVNVE